MKPQLIILILLLTCQITIYGQGLSNTYQYNNKSYQRQNIGNETSQYFIIKGNQLKEQGKYYDALFYLSKALEFDDTDPNIYFLAAKCYKALNNADSTRLMEREALIAFERGHYLKVSPYYMYHDYGVSSLLNANYEVAEYCFNEALKYKETAIAHHNLGSSQLYLEDYENACRNWKIAIDNGITESERLKKIWCKNCEYDTTTFIIPNDSLGYIDFYPINKDTLKVILYFTPNWELSAERTYYYRVGYWIKSKQMLDGAFTDYIKTSKIAEGTYSNGKLNGAYTSYFTGTKKRASTGFLINEKPTGKWIYFYRNGKPRMEIDINGDHFEIVNAFDQNGQKVMNAGNGKWRFSYYDHSYKVVQITGYTNNFKRIKTWTYETDPGGVIIKEHYNNKGDLVKRKISKKFKDSSQYKNGITSQVFIDESLWKINRRYADSPDAFTAYQFLNRWQ